jgi:hypothetical protein
LRVKFQVPDPNAILGYQSQDSKLSESQVARLCTEFGVDIPCIVGSFPRNPRKVPDFMEQSLKVGANFRLAGCLNTRWAGVELRWRGDKKQLVA